MKFNQLERLANMSIALAGISIGFIHALYGSSVGSHIKITSFSLLVSGLPFLLVTWSNAKKYAKSGPDMEVHGKILRSINWLGMYGIFSTIAGILLFFFSWSWVVALIGLFSFSIALTSGPFHERLKRKMGRARNIHKIRSEKTANKENQADT